MVYICSWWLGCDEADKQQRPAREDAGASDADELGSLAARICGQSSETQSVLPDDARAQKVQGGFDFVEGPVWLDQESVLLFTDMNFAETGPLGSPARMHRLRPPAEFDVFVEDAASNGLALDASGNVLACSQDVQSLTQFDPTTGRRSLWDLRYAGQRFNSPNDLAVRSDGSVYFTDPDYGLGPRVSETEMTGVYRVAPNRSVTLVTGELNRPNGIAFSLDERTLYVGSADDEIWAYPVDAEGAVGPPELFALSGASDGLTVDCQGNVYVTGDTRVQVFAASGASLGTIEVAEETTNVAFGGPARSTLYITGTTSLYAIDLNVAGMPY